MAGDCGWCALARPSTVDPMNSLTHPTPAARPSLPAAAAGPSATHWTLPPLAPVQTLACPAHQSAVLEVLQGCA